MATVIQKTMTAEEFFQWVELPSNRGRYFELHEGEVIELPPAGKYHGFVCANIAGILRNHAIANGGGSVCTNDAGVIVGRDPDTVRGPDVTYYIDNETADDMQRQYADTPPLLAVEVLSPHDRPTDVMVRVAQLLSRGIEAVWVVDPELRDVSVCRLGQTPQVFVEDQIIDNALTTMIGVRCCVSDFFASPGDRKVPTK